MDALAPQHTPSEDPTRAELIEAVVRLARGYERAMDLAESLLRAPGTTGLPASERAKAHDVVADGRAQLTALRLRVAALLDDEPARRDGLPIDVPPGAREVRL